MPSRPALSCGGRLRGVDEAREVRIGSRTARVRDRFARCTACEEEFYGPGQMDATLRRAATALRTEEGLLSPIVIRALRERLGLSQSAFERLLGVGPKTVVRWEKGTVFQNKATDSLLRVVERFPEVVGFLGELHGVTLPGPAPRTGRGTPRVGPRGSR
ncbi:MAG: type II TA system antitoxin MqsA family protein [Longimicrobiales bacterium]